MLLLKMNAPTTILAWALATPICVYAMTGCPPTPRTPVDDLSDATFPLLGDGAPSPQDPEDDPPEGTARFPACVRACAQLKALFCPEGDHPMGGQTCYRVCAKAEAGKLSLKPACVAAARTVEQVRECHTVRCGAR